MPYASRVMNGCNYGAEYLNAADSCFMTGDIAGAKKNAYEAIFRSRQKQQYGIECMANYTLVRIFTMKGHYSEVAAILGQMKQRLDNPELADSLALYDIIKGWFFTKIGEIGKIKKWIRHEEETRKHLPPVVVGREYLVRSDSLLAECRYDELLAIMGHTDLIYSERGILYAVIQNMITRAIIYHYSGEHQAAVAALNEAYKLSSPNNLIAQYVEYGNQMHTLLSAARQSGDCEIPSTWLDKIITKSSTYAKLLAQVIDDYKASYGMKNSAGVVLSTQEKNFLSHLCQGLTRKEMADSCNLSLNTIKSILKSIYNKLGAVNGADAVRIAGLMGLNKIN